VFFFALFGLELGSFLARQSLAWCALRRPHICDDMTRSYVEDWATRRSLGKWTRQCPDKLYSFELFTREEKDGLERLRANSACVG
jgi:hypothetical protein